MYKVKIAALLGCLVDSPLDNLTVRTTNNDSTRNKTIQVQ
jgi:hypothetical protein